MSHRHSASCKIFSETRNEAISCIRCTYFYLHFSYITPIYQSNRQTKLSHVNTFIFANFLGSIIQASSRVNTSISHPNLNQQIQRTRQIGMVSENNTSSSPASLRAKILRCFAKKYILLCLLCGGLCLTLGILYLVIFFLLTRYTTSLHYFQTLPTYIPAVVVSIETIAEIKQTVYGNVMVFS